jgi:HAD superfamily hydrolase (TIGR01549 family)
VVKGGVTVSEKIKAIFLDSGNTLRLRVNDASFQDQALKQLAALVDPQEKPEVLFERLMLRYEMYKRRALDTLLQASATEIWTRWMLPDQPADRIAPLADQLTTLFRNARGRHVPRPEVRSVVTELHRRGYVLGIITNTISETEIPNWLAQDGLQPYFKAVILSSQFGRRKPDPYIFTEAAYVAGVNAADCAYVGDNPAADIQGARRAGYGMVIILADPAKKLEMPAGVGNPDQVIHSLYDLLNIFH